VNVNLKLLQAFLAVAEHSSFGRAANEIGRTQSAVSMQIQQLEQQLRIKLFQRTTRRVRLTTEGEKLLTHVQNAMSELMTGLRQVERLAASHKGRVSIACAPSIAGSRLPAIIAEFQAAFPSVSARVIELPLAGIVECVRRQDVDFGIGPKPDALNGLEFRSMMADPICAVMPSGTTPARRRVALSGLARRPIVLMGGLRGLLEPIAQARGLDLAIRYEAQQILTVLGLVREGLGIGIVPQVALMMQEDETFRVLRIVDPKLVRQVGIITQRGLALSPIAVELTRLLEERIAELEPVRAG
jgi:DNA-binding transcriptional LysR family regulator